MLFYKNTGGAHYGRLGVVGLGSSEALLAVVLATIEPRTVVSTHRSRREGRWSYIFGASVFSGRCLALRMDGQSPRRHLRESSYVESVAVINR